MRFLFFALLFSCKAFAYQSSLNAGGKSLKWPNSTVPVRIITNTSDMSSASANNAIQNSIAEWNSHSSTKISVQGSALSEVSFKQDFSIYGPGVIGVTELTYTSSGAIQQAKVYLNDEYDFKATPGIYLSGEAYVGDVVTHELGHLFGLSHSEVLDATMFYSAFPGQSTLAADDRAGIRAKYGPNYGTISGNVMGGDDVGILGVHVVAFSRSTGEAVGVISDQDGSFSIKGLDLNDSYYLYTSPLKNLDALPGHFANVQNDFCPVSYVGGFFSACGEENEGFPQGITLTSSTPSRNVGAVTINCGLKTNDDYNAEKLQTIPDPVTVFDYSVDQKPEKAFVGYFLTRNSPTWSAWDKLVVDLSGYADASFTATNLRLQMIARQFGNLLEYEMVVRDQFGQIGGNYLMSSTGVSKTTDLEALVNLDSVPANNVFEIWIRSRKLSTVDAIDVFPELDQFVTNKNLHYLFVASLEEGGDPVLDTSSNLSDNASCLDAPFSYAVSKARPLNTSGEVSEKSEAPAGPVSCGTTGSGPSGPGGGGPLLLAMGFILATLLANARKSAKNFLS